MAEHLTVDIVDRPARGVVRTMRALRSLREEGAPGMRTLLQFGTAHFSPRPVPKPTFRRLGAIAIWESADHADSWNSRLASLCDGAREHWHVDGEITRASFSQPWRGWMPETDGTRPLDDEEPALILISGQLKARWIPAFTRDGAKAVRHAFAQPGYLGGLGINNTPLNTTSCSAWRSYADAKAYAFKAGAHQDAMRRDRAAQRHSTEWFLRIRPLAERGSLDGRAPFNRLIEP